MMGMMTNADKAANALGSDEDESEAQDEVDGFEMLLGKHSNIN